jgi:hypothetical protein
MSKADEIKHSIAINAFIKVFSVLGPAGGVVVFLALSFWLWPTPEQKAEFFDMFFLAKASLPQLVMFWSTAVLMLFFSQAKFYHYKYRVPLEKKGLALDNANSQITLLEDIIKSLKGEK